jgi:flagellar protein FlaJ
MSSLRLSLGRSKRASSSSLPATQKNRAAKKPKVSRELLGFDLLYHLSYLSAISAAGIQRSQVFRMGAELPTAAAPYIAEVDRLARTMNYQYAEACRIVGERAKDPEMKSLLLRMSSSLATGEQEREFMANEARIQAESYGNEYERKLESLRQWTDAYTAIIISSVLIIVVAAISTVIYSLGTGFVLGLVMVMILFTSLGVWVIYRTSPQELSALTGSLGKSSQKTPRSLFTTLFPTSLMVGALLYAVGVSVGWVLMVIGAMALPIGIAAKRYDKDVTRKDADIGTFLRVLGTTATSIGTTPAEALGRIDLRAMASVAPDVRKLYTLLKSRVKPELAWQRFVEGTGSELIARSVRVFSDGVGLGGDAEEVGRRASLLATKVSNLRAKRKLVSTTFGWLSVAMHATVVFLLVFVMEIVGQFGNLVQSAGAVTASDPNSPIALGSVFGFSFESMAFLQMLMAPVMIVLSIVNALAAYVADGGYTHKVFFNLGLTLLAAGVAAVLAPYLAAMIFSAAPTA